MVLWALEDPGSGLHSFWRSWRWRALSDTINSCCLSWLEGWGAFGQVEMEEVALLVELHECRQPVGKPTVYL